MAIASKRVSVDGKIFDMFQRVNRLIAARRTVDIGGKTPHMIGILERSKEDGLEFGTTVIPLSRGENKCEGTMDVWFQPQLEAIQAPAPSLEAQDRFRDNVREVALKIGDLGVHGLMSDVLKVFVEQGAIIVPGPVTKAIGLHWRGWVHSESIHRVVRGYFPTSGQTNALWFKIDRTFIRELKTPRRRQRD